MSTSISRHNFLFNETVASTNMLVKLFMYYFQIYKRKTFFLKILLDQGLFCEATDCPCFGLRVTLPMGFKGRVILSPALVLACGEPKGHIWYKRKTFLMIFDNISKIASTCFPGARGTLHSYPMGPHKTEYSPPPALGEMGLRLQRNTLSLF